MEKGQIVSLQVDGQQVYGWIRTAPAVTPSGEVVSVELLPDFVHLLPTGWTDAAVSDLAPATPCACAQLGYRREGRVFTTGCDFSRKPSKGRKFLPGHDAKAKGFLIKAWGHGPMFGGWEHSIDAAQSVGGDKISAQVAEGISRDQEKFRQRTLSRRKGAQVERTEFPATREDDLTPAQRLQRKHKVTDPMMRALAHALTQYDGIVGGHTGTVVAMQRRGLVEAGGRHVTRLGREVMDYDLEPEKPVCRPADDYRSPGVYSEHRPRWNNGSDNYSCGRCGEEIGEH
jgi:hypothetical protein